MKNRKIHRPGVRGLTAQNETGKCTGIGAFVLVPFFFHEMKPVNTRKGFYPDDTAGTFGVPVEEHLRESEVWQMDGYVSMGVLTGRTVPDTGLD